MDVHLKMFRTRSQFLLLSELEPEYKLQLLGVTLKACKVKVDSGASIIHAEILGNVPVEYSLTRTEEKMNKVLSGLDSFLWQKVWSNNLPTKEVFAFLEYDAVNGDYTKNASNSPNVAKEISLYVNGESLPARPEKMDPGTNKN